jgi:hypothetical protein
MECLGLHNKPKAEVHLGHLLTGPKEVEVVHLPLDFRRLVGLKGNLPGISTYESHLIKRPLF